MTHIPNKRKMAAIVVSLACVVATGYALTHATPSSALPQYAAATGQPCATCHVNPAGGGPRNATGQAFEAIPTHSTDPAGAFAIVSGAAATPTPTPAPAAVSVSVAMSGVETDDSVVYSIVVRNAGTQAVNNVFVSGSIPNGTTFTAATNTPAGAGFFSSDGAAAWLVDAVPAKGAIGPFVYKVAKNSAQDLSALGFAHWLAPVDGTATSATIVPISNSERLAMDQAINDKLNNADNSLTLWSLVPGNGPRMVDFARDINLAWFAGQAQNWTMALYEIDDQFPSDISKLKLRNATLAPSLTNFQTTSVNPVRDAVKAKDLNAFTTAFDNMIAGCNSCHAGRDDSASIKIIRPTAPIIPEIDFAGHD